MSQTEIYISAYPRSGTAWLTRLLNDILDAPRSGYTVRRGHFTMKDGELGPGRFYETDDKTTRLNPKQLSPSGITDEKLIFLVRDPRDICVSGAWLWEQSVEQFLERMIQGRVVRCGRWDRYIAACFNFGNLDLAITNYERLSEACPGELVYILQQIGILTFDGTRLLDIEARQSFATSQANIGDNEQALRQAGLRKGIVGDWRNHFTEAMNDKIWSEFGWMMERLGYEK